jgi:hypothetical protein
MARLTRARQIAALTLIVWKIMPTPRLCLLLRGNSDWEELGLWPSRKANRRSLGWYRPGLIPSGAVRERAFSFKRMSAWR